MERDLQKILVDLAEEFPLLATLVERQAGGQARLPTARRVAEPAATPLFGEAAAAAEPEAEAAPAPGRPGVPESRGQGPSPPGPAPAAGPGGPRRPGRYGLTIQFEARPDDPELARLVESTVWVNEAHPAHHRAVASRSEGYHLALAVAMALAPLAVEPKDAQGFITTFLARWGSALDKSDGRRRRRR